MAMHGVMLLVWNSDLILYLRGYAFNSYRLIEQLELLKRYCYTVLGLYYINPGILMMAMYQFI